MRRFLWVVLALIYLFGGLVVPAQAQGAADPTFRPTILAAVRVVVYDAGWDVFGSGSGSLISADGLVLTNYHVVRDNPRPDGLLGIQVLESERTGANTEYLGRLKVADAALDLAVLLIESTQGGELPPADLQFPFIPLGDADELNLGAELYAIGYPNITSNHVAMTRGMVSAFVDDEDGAWILSDVVVSQGNSGGMLVNTQGELVAVPTATRANDATLTTILYARPVNLALPLLELVAAQPAAAEPVVLNVPEVKSLAVKADDVLRFDLARLNGEPSPEVKGLVRSLFEGAQWTFYDDGTCSFEQVLDGELTVISGVWYEDSQSDAVIVELDNVELTASFTEVGDTIYLDVIFRLELDSGDLIETQFRQSGGVVE